MTTPSRRRALGLFGAAALSPVLVPVLSSGPARATPASTNAATWEDIVAKSSFGSYAAFEREWNYLYPWDDASTHNGAAKMYGSPTDHSQISLSSGILTLKATRLATNLGQSPHSPNAYLWWRSGAIHAKETILVNDQFPEWDIEGEFRTQTGVGIWPAFWTTGIWPDWPPESDILEYVGDSTNLFNTWSKGPDGEVVERIPIQGHNPDAWHKYRIWMTKDGDTNDVLIDYYFDGVYKGTHRGVGWAGITQNLIINLQMGSWASGIDPANPDDYKNQAPPGPTGSTYFRARNVWFGRTRMW